MSSEEITYKSAGVDTEEGQRFVSAIKEKVKASFDKNVLGGLGGFSAAYDVSFLKKYEEPVLLSCTDGVGTKVEFARLLDKHDTVGIDLVAMCVNDLIVSGGQPLFFLDYISTGKLDSKKMEAIVGGIVDGCCQAGTSLVGGETAEHPGLMAADEYDLAGYCTGAVDKKNIIDGSGIAEGDILIGLASSGAHSNGFSLLRKLFLKEGSLPENEDEIAFIREHVMAPTRIYVKPVLKLIEQVNVSGMVHITGGGFYENIPRILKENQGVEIDADKIPECRIFSEIQKRFSVKPREMFSTFNMGVGYMIIVRPEDADKTITTLKSEGEDAFVFGKVTQKGDEPVVIHF